MGKQYPNQIFCLHSKKASFDMQAYLKKVEEESNDNPLEMHVPGLSRLVATIRDNTGFVHANIPAWDLAGIFEGTRIASQLRANIKLNTLTPTVSTTVGTVEYDPDFTKTIPLLKKNVVDFLKSDGIEALKKKEQFLSSGQNEQYAEQNKVQAAILQKAIKAYEAGELVVEATPEATTPSKENITYEIYSKGPKPRVSKKDDNGNAMVYSITIKCHLNNDGYPWEVNIQNWYAPVSKAEDGSLRVGARATEVVSKSFFISDTDWYGSVYSIERTVKNFEAMIYPEMYQMAEKYSWHPTKE